MEILKAILVDDEHDSREVLAGYLSKYCEGVELREKCDSVKTGLEAIRKHSPDIVFLDIEMPYGNGFDLLDQAGEITFDTVFVTAFDNYAIQALNQSAAYYLLKPIDIDELVKAVEKIKKDRENGDYFRHTKVLLENLRQKSEDNGKIMLPTFEGFEIVPVKDILYCIAEDNFTKVFLKDRKDLLICRTLKFFEEVLGARGFVRVHRSSLINTAHVVRYTRGKGGYVTMGDGRELEVSPKKKSGFLGAFGG